ncbi:N-acetyl sugar amidotransferase [Lysinibacillus louembei]|uniref:N-acetyl sugar amidotransferase n=1 Tax=Lysinibacillus louembei TaxID=1470088 RepID=A0ABZ0RYN7_9BACI|nr:N-acetyl sugar amidotransferase [Lysinibacillus louembei]WPK12401.1 N-acetyl sugar amidotransferase [Lysinibacillus louembei]
MEKKNLIELYNLPDEVIFCKKCTISNQRPRITFDENGVCSACNFTEYKRSKIDWDLREKELVELLDKHRKNDGSYDVIVPCSGGKDGSFVAHQLKYKYGMNPLTVTWAPHLPTELGRINLDKFVDSGFDNVLGRPNGKVHRLMTKLAFLHLGDPFQPFIYGQTNFPLKVAVQNNVSLIMYGENGEVEYGGSMKNAFKPTREIADHDEHYFSGLPPEFWMNHGVSEADIFPYKAPKYEDIVKNKTEIHFFGYYKFWDPQANYHYSKENTGFSSAEERSEGTYSKYASLDDKIDGFHYYLSYIKFGIGRTTSDSAHEIREGKLTREEGIDLVKKYDGEFPEKYYKEFLEYCDITEEQFWEAIDSWRSEHIWDKVDGKWILKKHINK